MTSDDKKGDNVISLNGKTKKIRSNAKPRWTPLVDEKVRRLEAAEVELRKRAMAARRRERAFEQAHARLERRIEERTKELSTANARLSIIAKESARLQATFGKVMANLDHRVEERALELLRDTYGVDTKVVDGPGRGLGER